MVLIRHKTKVGDTVSKFPLDKLLMKKPKRKKNLCSYTLQWYHMPQWASGFITHLVLESKRALLNRE